MFYIATLPLPFIPGKQDCDGVKMRAGKLPHPVVRMITPVSPRMSARAGMPCLNSSGKVASDVSSTPSALRPFQVNASVTQRLSLSTEARTSAADCTVLRSSLSHALPPEALRNDINSYRPVSAGVRVSKMCWISSNSSMTSTLSLRCHCIWSSMLENAAFSLSAFLISSALTYGYSPYSRKLGH